MRILKRWFVVIGINLLSKLYLISLYFKKQTNNITEDDLESMKAYSNIQVLERFLSPELQDWVHNTKLRDVKAFADIFQALTPAQHKELVNASNQVSIYTKLKEEAQERIEQLNAQTNDGELGA